MKVLPRKTRLFLLRFLAVFVLAATTLFILLVFISSFPILNSNYKAHAVDGEITLTGYNFEKLPPAVLGGQWQLFPGLYFEAQGFDRSKMINPQQITLPIGDIFKAENRATYRLRVKLSDFDKKLVIYIPALRFPVNIFVNGELQPIATAEDGSIDERLLGAIFPVTAFDKNLPEQEIVISANKLGDKETTLYKKEIVLSTDAKAATMAYMDIATAMFIFGLLVLILLSGYIFMLYRPEHKVITLITLFDSLLILRVLFEVQYIRIAETMLFGGPVFSDSLLLSMQIMALMVGGIAGAQLSNALFDRENRVPKVVTTALSCAYLGLAIIFPFNLHWFVEFGVPVILVLYLPTFIVIGAQSIIYYQKERSGHAIFQIFKTGYVGLVILFDIYFLNCKVDSFLFSYLYMPFFTAHVILRLYDNNNSYKEVENLNINLEKTVTERTEELLLANKTLSELSERDFLTGAYNRLYFENVFEKAIAEFNEQTAPVHLCVFDLDNFKKINDTYGHDAGDAQLKDLVRAVNGLIDSDTVLARIGGEEFILLFRRASSNEAMATLETIRAHLEEEAAKNPRRTTASFGLMRVRFGQNRKEIFKVADACQYEAKKTGKNRIVARLGEDPLEGTGQV